jgi:hypothetical protein
MAWLCLETIQFDWLIGMTVDLAERIEDGHMLLFLIRSWLPVAIENDVGP